MRPLLTGAVLLGAMRIALVASPGDEVSDRAGIQTVLDAHGKCLDQG